MNARIPRVLPVLAFWFSALQFGSCTPDKPPNIVLLISDDQGWGDYGFMGHPAIQTPNLDRLAKEGMVFTRGYVIAPLCSPSLASIITGLYPHQHRITGNDPQVPVSESGQPVLDISMRYLYPSYIEGLRAMHRQFDGLQTLPRILAGKGYRSFQGGKWWFGHFRTGGFDEGTSDQDEINRLNREGADVLTLGRKSNRPVLDFMDRCVASKVPFFLWYAPMMPHNPHNDAPPDLVKKYSLMTRYLPLAHYWAMCEWFDRACGEIIDHIDSLGIADNTLVVYLGDNGWIQDPLRMHDVAEPRRCKSTPYEGGIRTPFIIRGPGAGAGIVVQTPVSAINITSTICKAATDSIPNHLSGVDLLNTPQQELPETVCGMVSLETIENADAPRSNLVSRWIVRKDGWKLIYPKDSTNFDRKSLSPAWELYNLNDDPNELRNLSAQQPEIVADLLARLNAWWNPLNNPGGQ